MSILALALGGDERLLQDHLQHGPREISDVILAVHRDLAGSLLHPNAGDGVLALAGGIGAALGVELLLIDARLGAAALSPLSGARVLERSHLRIGHGFKRSLHSWL